MPHQLHIYIFSYNRGVFLDNALQSVRKCLPNCPVVIIDDNSSDPITLSALDKWREFYDVCSARNDYGEVHRLGGLHNNMRYAFRDAKNKRAKYVLFIQDDMQLIRPILPDDFHNFDFFFTNNPNSVQLQPCFLKMYLSDLDNEYMYLDKSGNAYLRPTNFPGYSGFSDVGLFNLERFYNLFEDVQEDEYHNNEYAINNEIQLGYYTYPFMMYLPFSFTHRGRRRSMGLRTIEWLGRSGYYPYDFLSMDDTRSFLNRDISQKPYAEKWLSCEGLNHIRQWSYSGGLARLYECGGWRENLAIGLSFTIKIIRKSLSLTKINPRR